MEDSLPRCIPSIATGCVRPISGSLKRNSEKSRSICQPVKPAYLPPCRVCQSPASGIHYGVVTCEACKGFYRRNSMPENPYSCKQSGNCDLTRNRRCCTHCRFNKCVAVGMSKQGIRIGRYTLQTRTIHTLEVRKLNTEWASPPKEQVTCSQSTKEDLDDQATELLTTHAKYISSLHYLTDAEIAEQHMMYIQNHESQEWSSDEFLLDTVSDDITNNGELQNEMTREMEKNIFQYIEFIKSVPGFNELSSKDREQLIKHGRLEFLVLEQFPGYNRELHMVSISLMLCIRADTLSRIWGKEYMEELFVTSSAFKRMNLSLTELVLVEVICVMYSDRCALEEPNKVDTIQWRIVKALIHQMKKTHKDPMARFAKVIDRITGLRELGDKDAKLASNLSQWHFMQQSQLLMEVYDLS